MGRPSGRSSASELPTVESPQDVRRVVAAARSRGETIGVVPTMGALHEGHLSLIRTARRQSDFLVVTIFVNPAQFGPHEDFDKYPRTIATDLTACRDEGVDLVFHPSTDTMYPEGYASFVEVEMLANVLEGAHRPGHFRGVATVVLKLFHIVTPDVAFFGQKDYQQQLLIRKMCRDLDLAVQVHTCPTVREPDGLALSSRNKYLSAAERKAALSIAESLKLAGERLKAGEPDVGAVRQMMLAHLNGTPGIHVDYATVAHPDTLEELSKPVAEMVVLVAARVGETRLIDNMPVSLGQ